MVLTTAKVTLPLQRPARDAHRICADGGRTLADDSRRFADGSEGKALGSSLRAASAKQALRRIFAVWDSWECLLPQQ
jgi:hypothetical protein